MATVVFLGAMQTSPHTEVVDRVVVVVAGTPILASDVRAARLFGIGGVPRSEEQAAALDLAAVSVLIDRRLMLAEVDRYAPPEPTDISVGEALRTVRGRFDSEAAFGAALETAGLDEAYLRGAIRDDLRIGAYLDQRFTVVPPTEDEVREFFSTRPDRFMQGGRAVSFEDARPEVIDAFVDERRRTRVEEWLAGLRRRSQIVRHLP
jgi:hypothetical protein